jgi:hypothetical protein
MAKPTRKWTPDLARPIPYIPPPGVSLAALASGQSRDAIYPESNDKRRKTYQAAIARKMASVFEYFNIAEGDYHVLAIALAIEFVPGFKMAKAPVGARRKWFPLGTALLRVHIDLKREQAPHISFLDAARRVAKTGISARVCAIGQQLGNDARTNRRASNHKRFTGFTKFRDGH